MYVCMYSLRGEVGGRSFALAAQARVQWHRGHKESTYGREDRHIIQSVRASAKGGRARAFKGWDPGGAGLSSQHFGRPRRADPLRPGVRDQGGQQEETPSLLKLEKLASCGGACLSSQLPKKNPRNQGSRASPVSGWLPRVWGSEYWGSLGRQRQLQKHRKGCLTHFKYIFNGPIIIVYIYEVYRDSLIYVYIVERLNRAKQHIHHLTNLGPFRGENITNLFF